MNNTHFSFTKEDRQESMASRGRRIQAFSKKTNKANGPTQRVMLHGSADQEVLLDMKERICEAELLTSSSTQQKAVVESGRERLKRHREEMGGQVSIPDKWGQEELLKDWIDCSSFEALLVPNKIASARKALVADNGRSRAASHQLRIESRC